jgi:hypothetical protein
MPLNGSSVTCGGGLGHITLWGVNRPTAQPPPPLFLSHQHLRTLLSSCHTTAMNWPSGDEDDLYDGMARDEATPERFGRSASGAHVCGRGQEVAPSVKRRLKVCSTRCLHSARPSPGRPFSCASHCTHCHLSVACIYRAFHHTLELMERVFSHVLVHTPLHARLAGEPSGARANNARDGGQRRPHVQRHHV